MCVEATILIITPFIVLPSQPVLTFGQKKRCPIAIHAAITAF